MDSIFDIAINPGCHPSQFPIDYVRDFSVYIPPLDATAVIYCPDDDIDIADQFNKGADVTVKVLP